MSKLCEWEVKRTDGQTNEGVPRGPWTYINIIDSNVIFHYPSVFICMYLFSVVLICTRVHSVYLIMGSKSMMEWSVWNHTTALAPFTIAKHQHQLSKCLSSSSPTLTWKPKESWPVFSCTRETLTLRITGFPSRNGLESTRQPLPLVSFPFFAGTELSSRSQWPLPGRFLLLDNSSIFSLFLVFTSFLVKLGNMLCDLLTANYYYYADLKMIQNQINR